MTIPITIKLQHIDDGSWTPGPQGALRLRRPDPRTCYHIGQLIRDQDENAGTLYKDQVPDIFLLFHMYTTYVVFADKDRVSKYYPLPTWGINDILIGDCAQATLVQSPDSRLELNEVFGEDAKLEESEVVDFLMDEENEDKLPELIEDVPIVPTLCYSVNAPEMQGLGVHPWPEHYVYITVRFVNYFDRHDFRKIFFPTWISVAVQRKDNVRSLSSLFNQLLDTADIPKKRFPLGAKHPSTLFYNGHTTGWYPWKYAFWVLPQRYGVTKLFPYNNGKLSKFLSPERVAAGDKRLYMEVHIVPRKHDRQGQVM